MQDGLPGNQDQSLRKKHVKVAVIVMMTTTTTRATRTIVRVCGNSNGRLTIYLDNNQTRSSHTSDKTSDTKQRPKAFPFLSLSLSLSLSLFPCSHTTYNLLNEDFPHCSIHPSVNLLSACRSGLCGPSPALWGHDHCQQRSAAPFTTALCHSQQ